MLQRREGASAGCKGREKIQQGAKGRRSNSKELGREEASVRCEGGMERQKRAREDRVSKGHRRKGSSGHCGGEDEHQGRALGREGASGEEMG